MNKISAVAAAIVVALVFVAGSYFIVLLVSFDQWQSTALSNMFGWLWTTHSGQAVFVTLFILALWPRKGQPTGRNIVRRRGNSNANENKAQAK